MDKQCPDRQLLSVYFDGELPSPWKEKMESHIAACAQCAGHLQVYRDMSGGPFPQTDVDVMSARERIWQRLERRETQMRSGPFMVNRTLWCRRVSVPIPAAAAAIVLFVALAFILMIRMTNITGEPDMALAAEAEIYTTPGIIPGADMESVLQYLGSRDSGDMLILRMPESRSFDTYGEPAIIKAADYSRSMPGRRKP